jgi:superfamily I DNA/RNA helicase
MAWSKYQNNIFEYATALDSGSFAICAVAGSGKTTTEIECARRIAAKYPEESILFLAFNKSIVEELKTKTKEFPGIRCYTLHSLGLATLFRSKMKLNVNDAKYRNYIRDNYKKLIDRKLENEEKKKWLYIRNVDELLRLCRINMVKTGDTSRISDIAMHYGIDPIANEIDAVSKLLLKAQSLILFKSKQGGYDIDYTDMICLPLTDSFSKFIFKYDTVFIDEAQDLSLAQQELMLASVKKDGRFIVAGDPRQNINSFSGVLEDSFERLEKLAGKSLPLSVNYRCGTSIITEAQKLVPQIEAHEGAVAGIIEHTKSLADAQPGDMVLCRKTAPLLEVALQMIANGKSAVIKGKDIAERMKSLIDRASSDNSAALTLDVLWNRLDVMLLKLIRDLHDRGVEYYVAHPQYVDMIDKIYALKTIGSHCSDPAELRELIDKLFADTVEGNAVMLSTVHKAKGLEADNVFIICPELLPMRMEGQQEWEYQQELNLKYVAVTRAKKRLVWVDVDEKSVDTIAVV